MARSPRPLQELVGQVFREQRREAHLTLATLQRHWGELVGPGFAGRTWPTRLQQGLLWIAASDSSWAYQLQFLKQELLGAIRTGLPAFPVKDLRFKVGAVPAAAGSAEPSFPDGGASAAIQREHSQSSADDGAASLALRGPSPGGGAPAAAAPDADEGQPAASPGGTAPDAASPISPQLLRAADAIADPALRAAFLRALGKQADKQARRREGQG